MHKVIVKTDKGTKILRTKWRKIYADDGTLLYEGYAYHEKPCGNGTSYFHNGNKYQEGEFGIKGLLSGKEYYPDGDLKFEGKFRLNTAYGPNAPVEGAFYGLDGELVYQGKFAIRTGGVGYPMVVTPGGFGPIPQRGRPEELKVLMWDDVENASENSILSIIRSMLMHLCPKFKDKSGIL